MKILLFYQDRQFIEVLHLTPDEEHYMNDYESDIETEAEKIEHILDGRNIEHDMFSPWWHVAEDDVPIFDEYNPECPVYVIR